MAVPLFCCVLVAGCTISKGGPIIFLKQPTGPERVVQGVVNGLWNCTATQNRARLDKYKKYLGTINPGTVEPQCQVRVGVQQLGRMWDSGPRPPKTWHPFIELVILPPDWRVELADIIDDGRTVNFGDIVEVSYQNFRVANPLIRIVRKCNAARDPSELPEWQIGCRKFDGFDAGGYAGDHYVWTVF